MSHWIFPLLSSTKCNGPNLPMRADSALVIFLFVFFNFYGETKNEYGEKIQLFRDCYIHINEAFKALRCKRCTQEVLAHCWAHMPA